MSEFRCSNGHLMLSTVCPECGESAYTMDGMNANQLRQMEDDERVNYEEEEEDYE